MDVTPYSSVIATTGSVPGALLMAAGVAKLHSPAATARAWRQARLPGSRRLGHWPLIRIVAVGEILIAGLALGWGSRWSYGLVALGFLSFSAVVVRLIGVQAQGCGCFGAAGEGSPASRLHLVLNLLLAVAAGLAAATGPGPLRAIGRDGSVETALVWVFAALLSWLAYLGYSAAPALGHAVHAVTDTQS